MRAPFHLPGEGPSRREALKLFSAGAAALVAGCAPPGEDIVPYIDMPEGMTPGVPMFFATSLPLGGFGRGVVVESHEGRPTKVHGNALHPASLGSTDSFLEASVLDLFDPNRPRAPRRGTGPATWLGFESEVAALLGGDGAEFRLLTGPVASPTLARQIAELSARFPGMRWHACPAVGDPLRQRMGDAPETELRVVPEFTRTDVILSLGCDFLGPGPAQIAMARAFSAARHDRRARFRLHAVEAAPSLTGAAADHRTPARPREVAAILDWLAIRLDGDAPALPPALAAPLEAALADLRAAPGRGLVLVDPALPPSVARRAAAVNARLGAPLDYRAPADRWPTAGRVSPRRAPRR